MAVLTGWFDGLVPFVRVNVAGRDVDAIVDTGFDGDIMLPQAWIDRAGLHRVAEITSLLADGSEVQTSVFEAEIEWFGSRIAVGVDSCPGNVCLLGMHLMRDSRLTVCAREGIVRIESP